MSWGSGTPTRGSKLASTGEARPEAIFSHVEELGSISLPLDEDGFLRRECPTCEREFMWFVSEEGAQAEVADEGYFCPYCGVQAPLDGWWTKSQLAQATGIAYEEVVRPAMEGFKRNVERSSSGGFVQARVDLSHPDAEPELTEADNMRRVDFPCHSSEPLKVVQGWTRPLYCLICGTQSAI